MYSASYIEKIARQLERSSFQQLDYNPSDKLHKRLHHGSKNRGKTKFLTRTGIDLLKRLTRIQVKFTV